MLIEHKCKQGADAWAALACIPDLGRPPARRPSSLMQGPAQAQAQAQAQVQPQAQADPLPPPAAYSGATCAPMALARSSILALTGSRRSAARASTSGGTCHVVSSLLALYLRPARGAGWVEGPRVRRQGLGGGGSRASALLRMERDGSGSISAC